MVKKRGKPVFIEQTLHEKTTITEIGADCKKILKKTFITGQKVSFRHFFVVFLVH